MLLSAAVLAPHYHDHEPAFLHHHEALDDHVAHHDGREDEDLSPGRRRCAPHIHFKKDLGRTETYLRLRTGSLRADVYATACSPRTDPLRLHTYAETSRTALFRSAPLIRFSGLSPPGA